MKKIEVIRSVLNSLLIFFFYKKILHAPKVPKAQKAQRRNQAKAKNATSEQKLKNTLKKKGGKGHLFAYVRFCAFSAREEKKIENRKKRKAPTMHCKCTGLTKYVNVGAYIPTYTDFVSLP